MSVVAIGPAEQRQIAALIGRAKARPVPLAVVKANSARAAQHELRLADRKEAVVRPPEDHVMLGNVRVAFSVEEQPIGMCAHLSASVRKAGKLPAVEAVQFIAEAFGFTGMIEGGDAIAWLEEFDPGHQAVNVLWPLGEVVAGHA